ncbi:MAG TPA: winged helix-turn-helix domain-containing protein [Caulobacteraceae bacterium]|nr:winged helix-turn-helix domain-containing protein [Caulobacteraceae bacterium]
MTDSGNRTTPDHEANAQTERISLGREAPIRLGALRIEPARRSVTRDDGCEEVVEPRVMQVLVALAKAEGQILSRDDLLMSCWSGVVVGEDALNRVIARLRRVADRLGEFQIETITKVGYRLKPADLHPEEDVHIQPRAKAERHRASILVLPFANMSGDSEQDYFSDGVSEDIITDLTKVSALAVVARHTAFTFKGKAVDVAQTARDLKVSHVLEGSVRKSGDRVRITAQLIDGATGNHTWAERYDRDLNDIFALQDEISEAIVVALKLKLLPEEKRAIERRGTFSPEAYDLYLMACEYLASGNHGDARMAEAVVSLCRRATLIDPDYARAWALMAVALTSLHFVGGKPEDGLEAAEHALSLDDGLAEAHAVKARHLFRLGRPADAAAEIDIALRLDPESFEVNSSAGGLSFRQRKWKDAIRYLEKATALMDTAFGPPSALIACYAAISDKAGVRRAAATTLARAESALAQDRTNGSAIGNVVTALAALGEEERARDWSRRALMLDPDNLEMRLDIASAACAFLNDASTALELLGPYIANARPNDLAWVKIDPNLDSLREDPRFQAMIAAAEQRLMRGRQEAP